MKISPNQWTILEALKEGPRWIRSFQTVKPLLDDLIRKGFVERCRPHLGRGKNQIRLTDAGCSALEIDSAAVPGAQFRQPAALHETKRWTLSPARDGLSGLIQQTCDTFLRSVRLGSTVPEAVGQIAETEGVQRPAVWRRLRSGGVLAPIRAYTGKRLRRTNAEIFTDAVDAVRVDRDPCQRCGVRHDIGCKHNPAPVGMMFG
jgi:hypothetical protein